MNAYSPAELLNLYKTDLNDWASKNKAVVFIAKDPWNILELLAQSPAGMRIILAWAGDQALGEQVQAIGSTNKLEVILSYNLGLTVQPDAALLQASADRPALLDIISDLRNRVLSLCVPDAETGVDLSARYVEGDIVTTPDGIPLSAYKLKFEFDAAFPDYDMREVAE